MHDLVPSVFAADRRVGSPVRYRRRVPLTKVCAATTRKGWPGDAGYGRCGRTPWGLGRWCFAGFGDVDEFGRDALAAILEHGDAPASEAFVVADRDVAHPTPRRPHEPPTRDVGPKFVGKVRARRNEA